MLSLSLPKFEAEWGGSLTEALVSLGLETVIPGSVVEVIRLLGLAGPGVEHPQIGVAGVEFPGPGIFQVQRVRQQKDGL